MEFPSTLLEFGEVFPDEAACWQALRKARWPFGFRCPRCDHQRSSQLVKRRLEQCCRCRYQASVTAGTVLHRTQIPLRVWFLGIFFLARHKRGISALQFQKDAGLGSYQTAWSLLHKLRAAMGREDLRALFGLVEVDETYVGATRERGLRGGREVGHKTIVVGAVEQRDDRAGALRLQVLEGITFEHDLGPFVHQTIDPQRATVRTDGLASYRPLPACRISSRTLRRRPSPACQGDPPLDPPRLHQPQGVDPGDVSRGEQEAHAALSRRVRIPVQPARKRIRAPAGTPQPGRSLRAVPYARLTAETIG
jgi:hypothetical protein